MINLRSFVALVALAFVLAAASDAEACGCFAPPNPTVPVVQSGERILFAVNNGRVTAHVQVQYSGAAGSEFGWLLPMPAVPTLKLGVEEVFVRLAATTAPRYVMQTVFDGPCSPSSAFDAGFSSAGGGSAAGGTVDAGGGTVTVVVQDSVGPYDYAVLKADSATAMTEWLQANRFFIPTATASVVGPYLRQGAYFLALKLRPGATTGELQPVVLEYDGDVGQIPLSLTSVGAAPDMPVQVWMLGPSRAIPRNFHHVVLNDAAIDWRASGANYRALVTRAVALAPAKQAFVTEFSGSSEVMRDVLAAPGRFGSKADLAAQPTPSAFLRWLLASGFLTQGLDGVFAFPTPLRAILTRYLPPPPNVNAETFYRNYDALAANAPPNQFDPVAMANEIWERVVTPTQEAQQLLLSQPTLTTLFTTISPQDMTADPVFSFSTSLPPVSNSHQATMFVSCNGTAEGAARLGTEQGWNVSFPESRTGAPAVDVASTPLLRLERLREEGPPEVVVDNESAIRDLLGTPGSTQPRSTPKQLPGGAVEGPAAPAGQKVAALCTVTPTEAFAALGVLAWWRRRRSTTRAT